MLRLKFDRGTLLLHDLASSSPVASWPDVLWDARIARHRVPAFRYAALVRALRRERIPYADDVFAPACPAEWSRPDLRPYQYAALLAWDAARRAGIVMLPTGAGKTRLACAAMAASAVPTLCLVPTRALLYR